MRFSNNYSSQLEPNILIPFSLHLPEFFLKIWMEKLLNILK